MDPSFPAAHDPIPADLTLAELEDLTGVDADEIDRLVGAGVLTRGDGDRPFVAGDVYRIRLVLACEAAGMPADAIGKAIETGRLSLGFMDLPHYRWAGLGTMTYREIAEEMELPVEIVLAIAQSLGSIGRSPEDRAREDEREIFPLIRFASALLGPDALLRTARVYAQALERITDAEGALWDTYVLGAFLRQGMSFRDAVDLANQWGAEASAMQERLIITAYRRQQERKWNEYTVEGIESVLDEMGVYQRPERPNAFAFVDLAGFTRLTEERGDAESARIATELATMVDSVSVSWRGRPIKWLGDGVMVQFRDPADAVGATLAIVERAPEVGLPAHAGIAAGPVVVQDGDYYGRTVNLAARIASAAEAGNTYVSEDVVRIASGGGFTFAEVGALELKGFAEPVPIYEAVPSR
jgi:adenylate cyclase